MPEQNIRLLVAEQATTAVVYDAMNWVLKTAKQNGSWIALDDVENGIIPNDLQIAFNKNPESFNNYNNFAPSYRKSYLYWLNQAKREATRLKRIAEIIQLCETNTKSRGNW